MNTKMLVSKDIWHDLASRGLLDAIRDENENTWMHYDYTNTKTTSNVMRVWLNLEALKAVAHECRVTISNLEDEIASNSDNSEERSWLAKWRRALNKFNTELSNYGIKEQAAS